MFVRRLEEGDFQAGLALGERFLREARTTTEQVRAIHRHNGDAFWGVFRRHDSGSEEIVGVCAFLLLNRTGTEQLISAGAMAEVSVALLAPAGETPGAVYVWGIVAPGVGAVAVPQINAEMTRRYAACPLYATAATEAGLRLMLNSGYVTVSPDREGLGALYRVEDARKLAVARNARVQRRRSRLRVVPVTTADEFERAMAIRHVFLSEQNCPYDEEFDGNDRTGTIFLGYVDGEPAATARVRYFAHFFKLERLAVLPRFRRTLIAKETVQAAVDFCRRKGYRVGMGHAQKRFAPFWAKFGFKPTPRNCEIVFSDHDYVEMYGELAPHPDAITMESDPYLLIRREGAWDEPGILDRSAARPATNPGQEQTHAG